MLKINKDRKYWLVRTRGGLYYEDFFSKDFVGIGWNKISDIDAIKAIKNKEQTKKLIEKIKKAYPDEKRAGHAFNQIFRFVTEMNEGDIVTIPSDSSYKISFGEVLSDVFIEKIELTEEEEKLGISPYWKRRKIKWIKTIRRDELDPLLYKLFFSHHTISDANEYGALIDRTLYGYYVKDDNAHLILKLNTKDKIYANDILDLISGILKDLSLINKDPLNNLELKINVQSPGFLEFISDPKKIAGIATVVVVLSGGSVEVPSAKLGPIETPQLKVETKGLIGAAVDAYKEITKDEKTKGTFKKLNLDIPSELKKKEKKKEIIKPPIKI